MQTTDIEQQIRGFLVENFLFGRSEALRDDAQLLGDVIDSTGVIELVVFVQERFAITVEDEEVTAENLGSVNQGAAFVAKKRDGKK
jgi:acyl carrier protein